MSFFRCLAKYSWRLLLLVVLASVIVWLDKIIYPEVAFTPILCVIGLLVLSLTSDLPTVCIALPVFFVAMLVALLQTNGFDPSQPDQVARVCLRAGGFIITGSIAIFMCLYRVRLQKQLKDSLDLFQNIPLPIIIADESWKILDGNLEAARFLGSDFKDLTNKSFESIFQVVFADEIERENYGNWKDSSGIGVFCAHLMVIRPEKEAERVACVLCKLGFGKATRILTVLKEA